MIRFSCPCGKQLQAQEEDVGREAKCPRCEATSIIPAGDGPSPPGEDAIRADRPTRARRESREDDGERPRRRDRDRDFEPAGTSGKATAALLLGISALCLVVTAIPGAILGIMALSDISKSKGRLGGKGMAITGLVLSCVGFLMILPVALLLPAVQKVRTAAARMQDANNLMQLGLAMHNYDSTYGTMPQAAAYQDPNGKPLLSWRVALLPYVEQDSLYKRFRLDEPWDSPNNKALLPLMPKLYGRPGDKPGDANLVSGMTYYQVFVGPGSAFEPRKLDFPRPAGSAMPGWTFSGFTDGISNTILIATSATAVPWTKPDDMPFDPTGPLPRLGGYVNGRTNVGFADGSVKPLPEDVPDATLRALITRNGGEVVQFP